MNVCPRQQQDDIGILNATGQLLRGYIRECRMGTGITIPDKGKLPITLAQLLCLPGVESAQTSMQWGIRRGRGGTESLRGLRGSSLCSAPGLVGRSDTAQAVVTSGNSLSSTGLLRYVINQENTIHFFMFSTTWHHVAQKWNECS